MVPNTIGRIRIVIATLFLWVGCTPTTGDSSAAKAGDSAADTADDDTATGDLCACDATADICDADEDASDRECACDPSCASGGNQACAADGHCDTYCDPGGACVDPDCASGGGTCGT